MEDKLFKEVLRKFKEAQAALYMITEHHDFNIKDVIVMFEIECDGVVLMVDGDSADIPTKARTQKEAIHPDYKINFNETYDDEDEQCGGFRRSFYDTGDDDMRPGISTN